MPTLELQRAALDSLLDTRLRIEGRPEKIDALYVVTNMHTIRDGYSVVRLHKKDGSQKITETEPANWQFVPKGNDVAVSTIPIDDEVDQFAYISTDMFVGHDDDFFGLGENVFMVGRFVDHDGGESNTPSARFGNISMMPTIIKNPNMKGMRLESYCLDMHSRSGYSGSPVFVYRMPGGDLTKKGITMNKFLKFLGIHWGQFQEKIKIGGKEAEGPSGMTCVAPSWSIMEILNMPIFKRSREQLAKEWGEKLRDKPLPPVLESADDSDDVERQRDATLERMLNTPPKPRT